MLNLTRYPGQKIIVTHEPTGDRLTVEIMAVNPDRQVRVGLSANKCFLIDREEIYNDAGGHIDRQKARTK